MSEFDIEEFEKRLMGLKDTQESIQQLSTWCLENRQNHKKIVNAWLNVLKQDRVEHRLTLFYLANDVVQYSKRKHYEFVDCWGTALQKATTMVRDDRVREKISRIFRIWKEREIYTEDFLSDLTDLLNMNPIKKKIQQEDGDDFQTIKMISNINECVKLGSETDKAFKNLLIRSPNFNPDVIKNTLKDKRHSEDIEKDIDNVVKDLEGFLMRLKNEVNSRQLLIGNIEHADSFFENQKGEVKVVVNAYKNFGTRIKIVKKKLDELTWSLPSPIPSPDINAPSPEPDADIALPDDEPKVNMPIGLNLIQTPANGYTSYMEGNLPFDINDFKSESYGNGYDNTQSIQVIGTRADKKNLQGSSQNLSHTNLDKTYNVSASINYSSESLSYENQNSSFSNNVYEASPSIQSNNIALIQPPPMPPLLDLQNEFDPSWNPSLWSSTTFDIDTPVSPPQYDSEGSQSLIEYSERENDNLVTLKDVDHRKLAFPQNDSIKNNKENGRLSDVDHRNLISLTGGSISTENQIAKNFEETFQGSAFSSPSNVDVDHRPVFKDDDSTSDKSVLLKPPPLPPMLVPPPNMPPLLNSPLHLGLPPQIQSNIISKDIDIRENIIIQDAESIDMEMSDEDFEEHKKEESSSFNISSSGEMQILPTSSWKNLTSEPLAGQPQSPHLQHSQLDSIQHQHSLQQQQQPHGHPIFGNQWKQPVRPWVLGSARIPFPQDNRRPPLLERPGGNHFPRLPYSTPPRRGINNNNRRGNFSPRGRPFFRGPRPWM